MHTGKSGYILHFPISLTPTIVTLLLCYVCTVSYNFI